MSVIKLCYATVPHVFSDAKTDLYISNSYHASSSATETSSCLNLTFSNNSNTCTYAELFFIDENVVIHQLIVITGVYYLSPACFSQ
ncbi:unnamed protein product [Acanthoscelides obtectus]|uniref:Uncharacterized protein n=1 Tax=Acanthoscelides obtectus TaxID=200917 RepID=A0A9P0JX08_ACAOB|nr:unnamed protein product [Acanthoscelides obtectus]CAK1648990.1 hypothetical protein AOBTE_LOCUS15989 [Acanthoscelides obtectus]